MTVLGHWVNGVAGKLIIQSLFPVGLGNAEELLWALKTLITLALKFQPR
jgi:hypothetical protein